MYVFVHGVPDSPLIWQPVIRALGLSESQIHVPALPGFGAPIPKGFEATKDHYADWLIQNLEAAADHFGQPVRLVGHDWGALLTLRAASLRPDLIDSWCVSNAVIDSQYSGHLMAKLWATPVVGELAMLGMRDTNRMTTALLRGGVPSTIAAQEAARVDKTMRQSILKLYRSARGLKFRGDWESDCSNLPRNGMVYWGENDPYVPVAAAQRFCQRWGFPLRVERGAGHWAIAEQPARFASALETFWSAKPRITAV